MMIKRIRTALLTAMLPLFLACSPDNETPAQTGNVTVNEGEADEGVLAAQDFAIYSEDLMMRMLARSPEWSIYAGRYDNAHVLTIPDSTRRAEELEFIESELARLESIDLEHLPPSQRIDHSLLINRLQRDRWYQAEFRDWQWDPSNYNIAGPIGLLLNTDYAPEDERLRTVLARLEQVPDYYLVAGANIKNPTREHTTLAITQNQGTRILIGDSLRNRVQASNLEDAEKTRFEQARQNALMAVERYIGQLQELNASLTDDGVARSFRIGEALYEPKFRYDIQSAFTAAELYERAVAEKERLHRDMNEIALQLWPKYFPDRAVPGDPLERIGLLIDHLSERHIAREAFFDEINRQIPLLNRFVNERDILDQDPTRPLVVRETPEYMRGSGAGASISAPGPFNPTADTYYNVSPLDDYNEEQAKSYLREYNHWVLQILNIHEAIPGHYTQLMHANKSPSLIKSLLRNGAMIEGWGVYSERMLLEEGWGEQEPEMWLMYGKWNLRVVTNAIMDYAVHVLGMTQEEAMNMMLREAFQEQTEAENKWRRITLSQVQLTSYFTGYAEIYDFRERQKRELGEDFSLKSFHNQLLSYGNAPVPAIIELMRE